MIDELEAWKSKLDTILADFDAPLSKEHIPDGWKLLLTEFATLEDSKWKNPNDEMFNHLIGYKENGNWLDGQHEEPKAESVNKIKPLKIQDAITLDDAYRLVEQSKLSIESQKYDHAEQALRKALEIRDQNLAPDHPDIIENTEQLRHLFIEEMKDYTKAVEVSRRMLSYKEKKLGTEHRELISEVELVGRLYFITDKYDQAEPFYEHCLELTDKLHGTNSKESMNILQFLGTTYYYLNKFAKAEICFERCLKIFESTNKKNSPELFDRLTELATTYMRLEKYQKALLLFERAFDLVEKLQLPESDYIKQYREHYNTAKANSKIT